MQSETPGFSPRPSLPEDVPARRSLAERLLSFMSPKALFVTVLGGVLVCAALVLTLVASLGSPDQPLVRGLRSMAGYNTSDPFGYTYTNPINGMCPAGYRMDVYGRCFTTLPPQQAALVLNVSVNPTTVVQGGSYTLTATYVDVNGVTQKYSGQLDYQSRVCKIENPADCQTSTGAWGAGNTLVNGSVLVQLPPTILTGIYNAKFRPSGQSAWNWSNEIAVTVTSAGSGVVQGKIVPVAVRASNSLSTNPPSLAIDGLTNTFWNSGNFPEQWIEIDLGAYYNLNKLRLDPAQTPDGQVKHIVTAGECATPTTQVGQIEEIMRNGQWKELALSTGPVRYVRVATDRSPSWVAWIELEAYGTRVNYAGGECGTTPPAPTPPGPTPPGPTPPGPTPTTCLPGTVTLVNSNIVVNTYTTAGSTLIGYAITFDSDNHGIATVSNNRVTAGSTAGTVNITGTYYDSGRICALTPARLTVTGGNVQGSISVSSADIYVCTNSGASTQSTVIVSVTRGSGKVGVSTSPTTAGVTFQGPSRLEAPNTWTQVISPGNFLNLNSTPNGTATVTIALKDYFTDQTIDTKTVTARINPTTQCGGAPGQPSVMNPSVSVCNGVGKASVSAIAPVQAKLVANGSYAIAQLDVPNTLVAVKDANIGPVSLGQTIRFSLQPIGSSTELAFATATVPLTDGCATTTTCPTTGNTIGISRNPLVVGGSAATLGGPTGWTPGAAPFFIKSGTAATISGASITPNATGSGGQVTVGAIGWTAPNGATGCSLQDLVVTINPAASNAPVITGIQGLDSTTNQYSNTQAIAGEFVILYGTFSPNNNNTVNTGTITYQDANQINIRIGNSTGLMSFTVTNPNGTSNSKSIQVVQRSTSTPVSITTSGGVANCVASFAYGTVRVGGSQGASYDVYRNGSYFANLNGGGSITVVVNVGEQDTYSLPQYGQSAYLRGVRDTSC